MVVDDGSAYATGEVAELAGATVVRHRKNTGYGSALATCFSSARKDKPDVMVIIDGDG